MLAKWNDTFSVHNPDIDSQHQTLIDKVNELHDASLQGKAHDVLGDMLNFLADYAAKHFSFEEMYFQSYNWPGALDHIKLHEAFKQKVVEVKQRIETEGVSAILIIEISKFVSDWLITHIKGADHVYAEYIDSIAK